MDLHKHCFFSGQTSNATSTSVKSMGGMRQVVVSGNLDGGTLTIEGSLDGTNWVPIKAITALGHYSIPFTLGNVRAKIAGGGGSLNASVATYEDPDVMVVYP